MRQTGSREIDRSRRRRPTALLALDDSAVGACSYRSYPPDNRPWESGLPARVSARAGLSGSRAGDTQQGQDPGVMTGLLDGRRTRHHRPVPRARGRTPPAGRDRAVRFGGARTQLHQADPPARWRPPPKWPRSHRDSGAGIPERSARRAATAGQLRGAGRLGRATCRRC
jgi:hypothetical protein